MDEDGEEAGEDEEVCGACDAEAVADDGEETEVEVDAWLELVPRLEFPYVMLLHLAM